MDDTMIAEALCERLLPEPNPEDPRSCELHRFITSRAPKFKCPRRAEEWDSTARNLRQRFLQEVYLKGLSPDLLALEPRIEWKDTIRTRGGYHIRKLLYEGYPGMWIPALLYEPDVLAGEVPGVLNPNGHHTGGKAMPYKQARCINLAKRGMLALNTEFIGMGELTMNLPHDRIGQMDLCGLAGVAVFYLAMKRGLDVLLSHPNCDPQKVAMTGLSGGGWQTIVLSALDERITVTIPVAGHSPIWQRPSCQADVGDLEQAPVDLCTVSDYDALTALCAPRPTLLIYNKNDDCCFQSKRTRVSIYEPVKPLFDLLGVPDNVEFYENVDPGTHNYDHDNRSQLYRFLNKHFGVDTPETDLPYEDELLSEYQLRVGTPEGNANFSSLATEAMVGLPDRRPPGDASLMQAWIEDARRRLESVAHVQHYGVREEVVRNEGSMAQSVLRLDSAWSIPVTTLRTEGSTEVQVLLADGGRASLASPAESHMSQGRSVVAADIFGTGEQSYPGLYQMMVSSVGGRPLGILVGQIVSLMQWASDPGGTLRLAAVGTSTSFASLCAAALRPDLLEQLSLEGLPDSLRRLIELPIEYQNAVPLFCFGMLREFDVPELLAMTGELEIERPSHGPIKPVVF